MKNRIETGLPPSWQQCVLGREQPRAGEGKCCFAGAALACEMCFRWGNTGEDGKDAGGQGEAELLKPVGQRQVKKRRRAAGKTDGEGDKATGECSKSFARKLARRSVQQRCRQVTET